MTVYADADGDGYGDAGNAREACEPSEVEVLDATDCDDAVATTNPGAADDTDDDIDNDCDGDVDEDWDPCATSIGYLGLNPTTTYYTNSAGQFAYDVDGYGYVCSVSCPDWWLTRRFRTLSTGRPSSTSPCATRARPGRPAPATRRRPRGR